MDPHLDFPLSQNTPKLSVPMPASAFQMAAQIPDTWLVSPDRLASTALAVRKVVWRALLGRIYASQVKDDIDVTGTGSTPTMRRLGRLHDSAYSSWPTFLEIASQRIGVDLSSNSEDPEPPNPTLQCHLSSLHILRCLIGPVVESYIILDRVDWLKEELAATEGSMKGYDAQAVNLFDQKTGSGRNVALVVRPGEAKT
ncbi:hypothetical protein H0H93_012629 [Arthromyces matolae]|nr:hypothetical protein H0H93_012629 [Arthromyces matolae]